MTTSGTTKRHLRAVAHGDGQETGARAEEHAEGIAATAEDASAVSAPQSACAICHGTGKAGEGLACTCPDGEAVLADLESLRQQRLARDAAEMIEARSTPPPAPEQVNGHDAKVWSERVNDLLAAIAGHGAVIPPLALEQLRIQAQALAALRVLVNHLGVPEAVVQVEESRAIHQILSAILVQVEAGAVERRRAQVQPVRGPGLIVPGRQ